MIFAAISRVLRLWDKLPLKRRGVLAPLTVQAQGPSEWFGPMSVFTAQSGSCSLLIASGEMRVDHELCNQILVIRKTTSVRRPPPPLSVLFLLTCSSRNLSTYPFSSDLLTSGIRDSFVRLRSGSPSPLHPCAEISWRNGFQIQASPRRDEEIGGPLLSS